MKLKLYTNISQPNKVKKVLKFLEDVDGKVRSELDIEHPVFIFSTKSFLTGFNYVYIPDFERYYYVDTITAVKKNSYEVHLTVDVLMSFSTVITSSRGRITHSDVIDPYIDKGYSTEVKSSMKVKEIPIKFNANGQIIMIV